MRRVSELLRFVEHPVTSAAQRHPPFQPDGDVNPEFLNGWKEIATYVGRSVRAVQRWERMFGFPVHRPGGMSTGVVIASRAEIRNWVLCHTQQEPQPAPGPEFISSSNAKSAA